MEGTPTAYEDLSIPLFVKGYLIVVKGEEGVIKDKMATYLEQLKVDSELYGWEKFRTYNSVWMNNIDQGWAKWQEEDVKL